MLIDYTSLAQVVNGIGVVNVLQWLGFTHIKDEFNTVRAACKVHGGDRKDSFCIYKNTLVWKCFSKKCEENHGESFFALVAAINDITREEAVDLFCSNFGVDTTSFIDSSNDISDYKFRAYLNCSSKIESDVDIMAPKLQGYTDYFLTDRGGPFEPDTVVKFDVFSYYIDDVGRKRVFIPIYGTDGKLISYSGRAEDDIDEDKYYNCVDSESSNILYNLNNVVNSKSNYIIVVEGYKSVWRLYEYGYDNVVSSLGSALKVGQVKKLVPLFKDIVIFFDNDEAGRIGSYLAVKKFYSVLNIININYDSDKDPADMSKSAVDNLLKSYR